MIVHPDNKSKTLVLLQCKKCPNQKQETLFVDEKTTYVKCLRCNHVEVYNLREQVESDKVKE